MHHLSIFDHCVMKNASRNKNKYKQTTSVVDFQTDSLAARQDMGGFICV